MTSHFNLFIRRLLACCGCHKMINIILINIVLITNTVVCNFNFDTEPGTILYADNGRVRGFSDRENKDIILAAIIPIHQHQGLTCTNNLYVNETLDYVEAFLYSIDLINNDPNILPNITLGYDIRDSCLTESTAIEETVDLVLLSNPEKCQMCDADGNDQTNNSIPVSAIIGEYASFVTIPIANFLRLFQVPQISFSSTSALLNNREQYGYFYRTVPSDDLQVHAMIDLVLRFGWTYVSTLHSNDMYGEPAIDKFQELAKRNGICIDLDIGISVDFPEDRYQKAIERIYSSTASVIVFFSSLEQVIEVFDRMQRYPANKRFLWIGSDIWIESQFILKKYQDIVAGMWGIIPRTNPDPNFYSYHSHLTPSSNKRNPWFIEYYEEYYNCVYNVNCSNNTITSNMNYQNHTRTPSVIDAVFTFAHAVNNFLTDNCPSPIVWNATTRTCNGQAKVPMGSTLRDFLTKTSFMSVTGKNVSFDNTGSTDGIYNVLNYKLDNITDNYELVAVGTWNGTKFDSTLKIYDNLLSLQFGAYSNGDPRREVIQSQCQQCSPGFAYKSIKSSCCVTCIPCLGNQYIANITTSSSACMNCSSEMWGNNPLTGSDSCIPITESYLDPSDAWGIFLIILALIGLLCVTFFCVALGIFWNKPIVKASGREQMILLLVGIALSFASTIFFIIKPSIPLCLLQRISSWIWLSLVLSSLFIKLVRITRIFLRKETSARPRFIGPESQILFTFLIVGGQLILVFISLVVVYPTVDRDVKLNSHNTNDHPVLLVQCTPSHIILIVMQMLYFSALLVMSNALAMLTIRFPANFKEVVYVALSTFCIGIIWIAFIITYFATKDEFKPAIHSFAIQMSAFAVLLCTFGPRVFIIIFHLPQDSNIASEVAASRNFTQNGSIKVTLPN